MRLGTCASLFSGGGGWEVGAVAAGLRPVWSVELDPEIAAVYARNFHKQVPRHGTKVGSVFDVDPRALERPDVLCVSPPCVPGDIAVVLWDGSEIRADEVCVGDALLTHRGRGRVVTKVWKTRYTGDVCELVVWGDTKKPTRVTANHLVWVRRRGGHRGTLQAPRFVRADEVRAGDYVAFPRVASEPGAAAAFVRARRPTSGVRGTPATKVRAYVKRGKAVAGFDRRASAAEHPGARVFVEPDAHDLWWLVGQYLGDGQARPDRPELGWSVGSSTENLARIQLALEGMGLRWWVTGTATNARVWTSSKHLHAICVAFGRLAHGKRIPEAVYSFERDCLRSLLEGYLDADGSPGKGRHAGRWSATSTSLALLQGLQRIAWQLGWTAGVSVGDGARGCVIEGRAVQAKATWSLRLTKEPGKQSRTKVDDQHVWRSVRRVETTRVEALDVFDFEVGEDHTFCLPGVVVHNCQSHSRARMREGLVPRLDADAGRAVVDFLTALRPSVMLLENVDFYEHHPAFRAICDAARALGYEADAAVLDASEHGVPSSRRRLVARFALGGLPPWPRPRPVATWLDAVRDLLPTFAPSKLAPWQAARVERLAASPQGQRMPGPWLISSNNVSTPAFRAGKVIRVARGADEPAFAVVASYAAMSQTRVLFEDGRVVVVPPRGFARFQSFPDDYELPESDRLATRVLGNAVPPGLSLAMLRPFLAPGGRARTPRQLDLAV
jgi:site-specific DNA-cytosine methylase